MILVAIATETAVAGRSVPEKDEVKQPEWLFHHDGSFLIPGIGRVLVPPAFGGFSPNTPYTGNAGGGSYVPGGDDTFVPNPGFEVPNPANGGAAPAPSRPWVCVKIVVVVE